jgi:hypothetical protein
MGDLIKVARWTRRVACLGVMTNKLNLDRKQSRFEFPTAVTNKNNASGM